MNIAWTIVIVGAFILVIEAVIVAWYGSADLRLHQQGSVPLPEIKITFQEQVNTGIYRENGKDCVLTLNGKDVVSWPCDEHFRPKPGTAITHIYD